jgi:hypothetical protein
MLICQIDDLDYKTMITLKKLNQNKLQSSIPNQLIVEECK